MLNHNKLTKWTKNTRSSAFWQMVSSTTWKRQSTKSCEAPTNLCPSSSSVLATQISLQWRCLMLTKKLSTPKLSVNTWLPTSSNLFPSTSSSTTLTFSPKRFSTRSQDSFSTSCASTISSLSQELRNSEELSRHSYQWDQTQFSLVWFRDTSPTRRSDSCNKSLKWALTYSWFKTSLSKRACVRLRSTPSWIS